MEDKKKVLFTATVDSHILQFHLPFLKIFKEKGYEVHVATNGNEEIPFCDVKHVIPFERNPLKINNLKAIKQLKKICEKEKYDIIHTHTPMGSVVTRLAAKSSRKKYHTRVIYTAHGFHFFKGAPLKNWLIYYPVEKWMAKYTDTLITINKEDYELANNKFNKRCSDIQYVPGVGIDEEKFNFVLTNKEKNELRESLGIKEDDFVMIYPAELNKNKNQLMIINAMEVLSKKHNNIKVLLPGIDSYNNYYQNLVKEKGLDNSVLFLGYRKDIPKLLKISDLALATSYREGLPLNVMEAMYTGLPIIATDCRGQRDLVKNADNGFVIEINNDTQLTQRIEQLLKNKSLIKKMSEKSKEIINKYLLKNILKDMKKVYFKQKKILHLLSSSKYSGAENVVCTIINGLNREYKMFYCSPEGPIKDTLKDKGIQYISIKKLSYFEIRKVIKSIKPDIIHAHDNKATVYASFFSNRCKIISHIHGNNTIMKTNNIKTALFNMCSRRIDQYIWVSNSSLNDYFFKNNIMNKSIVLYNTINTEEVINKSNEFIDNNYFDLIFLGRLGYPKNPMRVLEIIKQLKKQKEDITIAIVGDGNEKAKMEEYVHNNRLEENVKFFGYLSNPFPILKNSKVLIMTSIYEGTPMSALEAQALGKPIISTPVDGLKDLIINGENGFLVDSNEDFCKKIIELLNKDLTNKVINIFKKRNNINDYLYQLKSLY